MAQLWTDILTPAELTGYTRAAQEDWEVNNTTLAQFLPNRFVRDVIVRFTAGQTGFVEEADFRAYDAEPTVGRTRPGKRVTIELPAIGRTIPVSEYNQIRGRDASEPVVREMMFNTAREVARAVSDRMERLRGTVLVTGKATIDTEGFKSEDDFGRDAALAPTAGTLWNAGGADPIADLKTWRDLYVDKNGVEPGAIVLSRQIMSGLANHDAFKTVLVGGGSRPATEDDVRNVLAAHGLPPVYVYARRTASGLVLPNDRLLMLPAPVAPGDALGTELGGTFWGQTLTSEDPGWDIAEFDRPGIVVGAYRNPKPPMIAELVSDAIGMPVLANATLSLAAKVL